MNDEGGTAEGGGDGTERLATVEAEFRKLVEDRFLDGLVRRFGKQFPDYVSQVEDVLFDEFVKLIESTGPLPKNIRAVLTWRMRKRMLDITRRPRHVDEDDGADLDTPERQVVRKEMFGRIKSLVEAWPNRTMAFVIRLQLEAVYYGEVLEVDDVKEIVAEHLGHELTTANVWKLRSRGLRRLAEEVAQLIGEDTVDWDLQPLADEDDSNQKDEEL